MGEIRQKAAGRAKVIQVRQQWPVRLSLLGAGAVAALAALAACSASGANPTSHAATAVTLGTAATGRSVQGTGAPEMISRAIASGKALQPTPKATRKQVKPKATPTKSGTTTATPSATPTGTLAGGQNGADPSGQSPAAALSGFSLKYVQEFSGDSAPPNWNIYGGVPGGESSQEADWVPSMCTFSGGEAHFMASGVDSCGMKYLGKPQEYGAWFARLQAGAEPSSVQFSDIFLLWPGNFQWPPEIDIYEDKADQSRTTATMFNTVGSICGSSPTISCLEPYEQGNDAGNGVANTDTEWHTYGVEWTPSSVSWLIDGNVVFTAPASQVKSPAQQPALPMDMALQSQNLQGAGTPTQRETMTVDWVEQFSWNG
jgi:hypothetical protein